MPEQDSSDDDVRAIEQSVLSGLAFLVYRDAHDRQEIYELPEGGRPTTIGRGSWVDVPLAWDDQVSRVHAQLQCLAQDWTVVDEGLSSNGTFLNGERVEGRRRLSDGDEIKVGETLITIWLPDSGDSQRTVVR